MRIRKYYQFCKDSKQNNVYIDDNKKIITNEKENRNVITLLTNTILPIHVLFVVQKNIL